MTVQILSQSLAQSNGPLPAIGTSASRSRVRLVTSLRSRQITFIEMSWDRFQMAQEINELYASGADGLFVTLKDMGLAPEREFPVRESGCEYVVDVAIPCHDGTVAIVLDDRPGPPGALRYESGDLPVGDLQDVIQAVDGFGGAQPSE